ncbi:MAG: recombinase family protein [Bacilli bacterium]
MLGDVDEEIETIKKLGQWYLEDNATLRSITIRANNENLKGVQKYWDSAVVRNILKNPIYVQNTPKVYEYFKNNKIGLRLIKYIKE